MTRYWPGTFGLCCLLFAVSGCASAWDEMLSHERDFAYMTGFGKPNPLVVIRNNDYKMANSDGVRRAQALAELREPLKNGGNAKEQELYLDVLVESATKDTEPICRLAAIRALGKFGDPRAARALEQVHKQQKLPFTPDNNHMIRKEALVALEMTKDPEAWKFMVLIARAPAPSASARARGAAASHRPSSPRAAHGASRSRRLRSRGPLCAQRRQHEAGSSEAHHPRLGGHQCHGQRR